MQCPNCEKFIGWDWLQEEEIEGNDEFECPHCDTELRLLIDESTYYGAQETTLEIVDD